jgi:hypothetical protein
MKFGGSPGVGEVVLADSVIAKLRAGDATRQVSSIRSDFGVVAGSYVSADRSVAAMTWSQLERLIERSSARVM